LLSEFRLIDCSWEPVQPRAPERVHIGDLGLTNQVDVAALHAAKWEIGRAPS
jgi:hypothetical protein